jgi:TRAP-type transport system small permease protein
MEHWIVAILLLVMSCITFINILSRYFFHFSFAATEEITINLFVWMTVVGSGIAFNRGAHLGMVTLFDLFAPRFKKAAILLSSFLAALLFLLVNLYLVRTIYERSRHRWFAPRFKKAAILLSSFLAALLFLLVNLYLVRTIYDEIVLFHATSGALGVPVWLYYGGVPVLSIFVFKGIYQDASAKLKTVEGEAGE